MMNREKETSTIVTFFITNPTWNCLPWDIQIKIISEIQILLELNIK